MKFLLCCDNDPVSLGIEDDQGNLDMTAFKDHVDSCKPCTRFVDLLVLSFLIHSHKKRGDFKAMKFLLCCDNDPVSLGIEDDQGNLDMTAFKDHVDSCKPCTRFVDLLNRTEPELYRRLYAALTGESCPGLGPGAC